MQDSEPGKGGGLTRASLRTLGLKQPAASHLSVSQPASNQPAASHRGNQPLRLKSSHLASAGCAKRKQFSTDYSLLAPNC